MLDKSVAIPKPVIVSLKQIAAWDLDGLNAPCEIKASVPALQRGLVWSPQQVELLWDSILRGFPIGSFVVGAHVKTQERGSGINVTHHLLDGQQRSNAIALGFHDPYSAGGTDVRGNRSQSILWLDLDPTRKIGETELQFPPSSTREFLVRVTTLAHPWGYRPDDGATRLSASQARESVAWEYEKPARSQPKGRPVPLDLFPWHTNAPVPLSWLMRAVDGAGEAAFWQKIETRLATQAKGRRWPNLALTVLREGTIRLQPIYLALRRAIASPLIVLEAPSTILEPTRAETKSQSGEGSIASIEHLFNRLNGQGTPLSGEELAYSMIKAYWPEVADVIDAVKRCRIPASHLVSIGIRAALTPTEDGQLAPSMSIPRLRAIASAGGKGTSADSRNRAKIKKFLGVDGADGTGTNRLAEACAQVDEWLVYSAGSSANGLPPVLVSSFARSNADTYLFFIHLADRLRNEEVQRLNRRWNEVLPAVAMLVHWFASDQSKVANLLIEAVAKAINCKWLIAPRKPDAMSDFIKFPDQNRNLKNWKLWAALIGAAPEKKRDELHEKWWLFLERTLWQREMLLFAQRDYLNRQFPEYDPSRKDLWENTNRPWDFDHVHASAYFYNAKSGECADFCREWGNTIGNLRAWPFEENRSDLKQTANEKLGESEEEMKASLIESDEEVAAFSHGDQARLDPKCARALGEAIRDRFIRIYKNWYEGAGIGAFVPATLSKS
jgi:hypothetical protein